MILEGVDISKYLTEEEIASCYNIEDLVDEDENLVKLEAIYNLLSSKDVFDGFFKHSLSPFWNKFEISKNPYLSMNKLKFINKDFFIPGIYIKQNNNFKLEEIDSHSWIFKEGILSYSDIFKNLDFSGDISEELRNRLLGYISPNTFKFINSEILCESKIKHYMKLFKNLFPDIYYINLYSLNCKLLYESYWSSHPDLTVRNVESFLCKDWDWKLLFSRGIINENFILKNIFKMSNKYSKILPILSEEFLNKNFQIFDIKSLLVYGKISMELIDKLNKDSWNAEHWNCLSRNSNINDEMIYKFYDKFFNEFNDINSVINFSFTNNKISNNFFETNIKEFANKPGAMANIIFKKRVSEEFICDNLELFDIDYVVDSYDITPKLAIKLSLVLTNKRDLYRKLYKVDWLSSFFVKEFLSSSFESIYLFDENVSIENWENSVGLESQRRIMERYGIIKNELQSVVWNPDNNLYLSLI
jgi:hypothetical protein